LVSTLDIIRHMEVPNERGVFILGSLESRVTLYSQQVRALNLVHALFEQGQLQSGSRVAVVGGGAAGLTAAVGAAVRGCQVTLLEERSTLLPLWRQNRSRWLHPHIYDWPREGSEADEAHLPVLNWKAGLARDVADQLLAAWNTLAERYGIQVHTGAKDVTLQRQATSGRPLTWNTERFHTARFDVVILAVGFGLERQQEGVPLRSYWDDDNLESPQKELSKPKKEILISGTGDGGLVEILRVRLSDFRHECFVKDFLSDASLQEVKRRLLKLEEELLHGKFPEDELFEQYDKLPVPPALDEKLRQRLRPDTTAVLNGMGPFALSARASILNRFLASRLIRLGVTYEPGKFKVKPLKGGGYKVTFLKSTKARNFDEVIIRHGAESALKPLIERSFKGIWKEVEDSLRALAKLDQTRTRLWGDEDFAANGAAARLTVTADAPSTSPQVGLPRREHCFGREELVRQLVGAILAPEPLPTVVLGPPGIGKSTLTIEALYAPEVVQRYGARRFFVRLDSATSPELMVGSIATVLGIPSESNLWGAVKESLGSAPALLILDNTETPWEANGAGTEALLAQLRDLPGLALVCSVRGRERPAIPRAGPPIHVPKLDEAAARQLFCSIASDVTPEEPLLGQLLSGPEGLDGLALAIKLLAQASEGIPLELTQRLWQEKRTTLLAQRGRTDAQSSLAASVEISINGPRMTDAARQLLSLLAWLPAGVAQEDVELLLPEKGLEAARVLSKTGLAFFERSRLQMLAPIREHVRSARRALQEDVNRATLHYLKMARELGPRAGAEGGAEAVVHLNEELPNVEHLIAHELESNNTGEAIDAAIALSDFIQLSGYGTSTSLQQAREAAKRRDDAGREANCIKSLGDIALARSEHTEARSRFEEALPLYERVGSLLGKANCIQSLGDIALARSEHTEARSHFEEALLLYHRIPEPYSIGGAHLRLARMAADHKVRRHHADAAREAWQRIDRPDLIQQLDTEFGNTH